MKKIRLFWGRIVIDKTGIGVAYGKNYTWEQYIFPEWLHHLLGYCSPYHKHN